MVTVAATELKNKLGQVIDQARREPVFVQTHGRNTVVIVDHTEFIRLQALAQLGQSHQVEETAARARERARNEILAGKYAQPRPCSESSYTDDFIMRKADEKSMEERRWESESASQ